LLIQGPVVTFNFPGWAFRIPAPVSFASGLNFACSPLA